jgi:hypothetical protein
MKQKTQMKIHGCVSDLRRKKTLARWVKGAK